MTDATDSTAPTAITVPEPYRYEGCDPDADWRENAQQRIEKHRKADLDVTVVDTRGDPVEGATVDVTMQAHAFDWGTCVATPRVVDTPTYRDRLAAEFNYATVENGLKAAYWAGAKDDLRYSVTQADVCEAVEWLTDQDVDVRGHALIWEAFDWLAIDPDQPPADIDADVQASIRERASPFTGQLTDWDMHNHPIWQDNVRRAVGRERVPEWWATARDTDDTAALCVNEINVLSETPLPGDYADPYEQFIEWLLEAGVDLGGIGFMTHCRVEDLRSIPDVLARLDRFADFGVPLQLTEFHVELDSRADRRAVQAQAAYVRDVLTAAFSHPAVETLVHWGFWAGSIWKPTTAFFDADWTRRPHGEVYRHLVFERWWTDETGDTDTDGRYATRGFRGEYEITATDGERSGTTTVTLTGDGDAVGIELA